MLTRRGPSRGAKRRISAAGIAWLFILPYLLFFLIFRGGPYLAGVLLSFTHYTPVGFQDFAGLDNYTRLLSDPLFFNALRVTLIFTVIVLPLTLATSMGAALLCLKAIRGIKVFRALFFLPVVTSLVVAGVVWSWLYQPNGPINALLGTIGIDRIPFLSSSLAVLPALAVVMAWTRFGYEMLILMAALNEIPEELYDAAKIDGASSSRRFFSISLPLIRPALFYVLLIETAFSFQIFDIIFTMTGGGPVRASYSLVYMIYDQAFTSFDFGYASAAGVVLLVLCLAIALLQRRFVGKEAT